MLLLGAVLEGISTFSSALALLAGIGRVVDWITSRALRQGLLSWWYGFLAVLPDVPLPFDLTLPEALAAVVFGWRRLGARALVVGTFPDVPHADVVGRTAATRAGRLVHSAWLLISGDLRTKYPDHQRRPSQGGCDTGSGHRLTIRSGRGRGADHDRPPGRTAG